MKKKFWEAMVVILLFAMSGLESCPLMIVPIAGLWALSMYNLKDMEIEC